MMEAFKASLDKERPSGDDPKRVASALHQFYSELEPKLLASRELRWKTELFKKSEPRLLETLKALRELTRELSLTLPSAPPENLQRLDRLDQTFRTITFQLEEEEKHFDLPTTEAPHLAPMIYFYEGWKRGVLADKPFFNFLSNYYGGVKQTLTELTGALKKPEPRECEEETAAIERGHELVTQLRSVVKQALEMKGSPAPALQTRVDLILSLTDQLKVVFETLEQCAPIQEPCPFCGGQLSLSGRCRSCTRRLPHLEEAGTNSEDSLHSDFQSINCRELDLAIQAWENSPEDREAWKVLQEAVRAFSAHVSQGKKSLDMLAANPERPIDADSELRKKEEKLKQVANAFQNAVTTLGKFSSSSEPPLHPLAEDWRTPLLEAEEILKNIELSVKPDEEESPV